MPSDQADAPRRRPWWKIALLTVGGLVVLVVVSAIALYYFGGPSGSVYDPQIEREYEALLQKGEAYPVEKRFTIPIPGCQCHSTDPSLTQQHRYRHMNECMSAGCHG